MNDFIWHKHKHFCLVLLSNVANNMVDSHLADRLL
jgi:hypothetical protein